jgi:hypothetical protein
VIRLIAVPVYEAQLGAMCCLSAQEDRPIFRQPQFIVIIGLSLAEKLQRASHLNKVAFSGSLTSFRVG